MGYLGRQGFIGQRAGLSGLAAAPCPAWLRSRMNPRFLFGVLSLMSSVLAAPARTAPTPAITRLPAVSASGLAASVRVADVPLLFAGPVYGVDGGAEVRGQAERGLTALAAVLARQGADLRSVVRLTAYVAREADVTAVRAVVAAAWRETPVAFAHYCTPLEKSGALIAWEAVAVADRQSDAVVVEPDAALMPAGARLFISGQAEKGTDVASAVRLTMAGLHRSLGHLGLTKADVVQVKAFVRPIGDQAAARREIAASFAGGPVPPAVIHEWVSELYTEIELVVSARRLATQAEPITHAWLPWLNKSNRYCHVTTVAAGTPLIFVGAVDGGDVGDARAQMKVIFERLGSVLFEAGSSYRNLAKATYVLVDPAARAVLGDIRGVYFDPTRPPAASALNVRGTGVPGRAAWVDLIAVPGR
jgi:enamine deaminase RidA (YjgF/YER057c/UK114 family)